VLSEQELLIIDKNKTGNFHNPFERIYIITNAWIYDNKTDQHLIKISLTDNINFSRKVSPVSYQNLPVGRHGFAVIVSQILSRQLCDKSSFINENIRRKGSFPSTE